MDRIRSNEQKEIPLFLLPHAIAQQIKKTGDQIYRISVKRTRWHHYNVSVRTKSLPRELMPGRWIPPISDLRKISGYADGTGGAGSL